MDEKRFKKIQDDYEALRGQITVLCSVAFFLIALVLTGAMLQNIMLVVLAAIFSLIPLLCLANVWLTNDGHSELKKRRLEMEQALDELDGR